MSQISDIRNPWRDLLRSEPASFRGVIFHVEQGSRISGRRTVLHEYPKRPENLGPYAEDMGRHARRFTITGYLIYKPQNGGNSNSLRYNYVDQRRRLYTALEEPNPGKLKHPALVPGGMDVMCERFTMTESRDRGGFTQFEMSFVEAGNPVNAIGVSVNTSSSVNSKAASAESSAVGNINITLSIPMPDVGMASAFAQTALSGLVG